MLIADRTFLFADRTMLKTDQNTYFLARAISGDLLWDFSLNCAPRNQKSDA
jgi:hypothetical protein